MMNRQRIIINKVPYDNITTSECIEVIKSAVENSKYIQIVTPNIDHLAIAENDPEFLKILQNAELSIADGMGIIYLSRMLGKPIKENIGGRILFMKLCRQAVESNWKLFFMGSKDRVASQASLLLKHRFSDINIVGAISPSNHFSDDEREISEIINIINKAQADILFVGVGTPKSEKWIYRNRSRLNVKVALVVGHAFDLMVGKVRGAPPLLTKYGFEWLYRLIQNPQYLLPRYIVRDIPFFLRTIIKNLTTI